MRSYDKSGYGQAVELPWINRLGKWRSLFAGWQLGTRPKGDPESDAVRDHREATLIMRAELNALISLLVSSKVFTRAEYVKQLEHEARLYCERLAERFPGVIAVDDGLQIDERAQSWLKDWKP